jgi:hypothetical protein
VGEDLIVSEVKVDVISIDVVVYWGVLELARAIPDV